MVGVPSHKLCITVPDGTSLTDMNAYADELKSCGGVRRISFVGVFICYWNAVELVETDGACDRHSNINRTLSAEADHIRNSQLTVAGEESRSLRISSARYPVNKDCGVVIS